MLKYAANMLKYAVKVLIERRYLKNTFTDVTLCSSLVTLCCIDCPLYIVLSCLGCAVVSCLVRTVVVVLSVLLSSYV
jgi:hypothetical protein